jgi:DNA-binding NarL/FixJ family response regulator
MLNENVRNVLLVDDDEDECMLFELALQEIDPGIQLIYSNTCCAGLKEVEDCKPDLVFLDMKLGAVSGHECLKALKDSASLCHIPVVVYSSSSYPKDILFSYQLGASLYFRKTNSYPELVRALKDILSMAWNNPAEVTKKFHTDKGYSAFQLEL